MKQGFIYKIIAPNNKAYIGQVVEFLKNGEKKGIKGRWLQHCSSAKSNAQKGCFYLNRAINKYKPENFKIIKLLKCDLNIIDLFEEYSGLKTIESQVVKTADALDAIAQGLSTPGARLEDFKLADKNIIHDKISNKKLKKILEDSVEMLFSKKVTYFRGSLKMTLNLFSKCILSIFVTFFFLAGCATTYVEEPPAEQQIEEKQSYTYPPFSGTKVAVAVLPLGLSTEAAKKYPHLLDKSVGLGVHNRVTENLFDTGRFRFVEEKPEIIK